MFMGSSILGKLTHARKHTPLFFCSSSGVVTPFVGGEALWRSMFL